MSSDSLNDHSRPPSPTDSRPQTPGLFSSSSNGMGFFSVPFERFVRDDASEWTSAFTLLGTLTSLSLYRERGSWNIPDTVETFFDSRMDLLERRLKKQTDKLKMRAEEAFKFKAPSGDIFVAKDLDREVQKFKLKVIISPFFTYFGSTVT